MKFKLLAIPLGFLLAGMLWISFSNSLFGILTKEFGIETQKRLAVTVNFVFVAAAAFLIYTWQKRQYDKLLISGEQYRRLFESNPNPMWINHAETLKFVKVNDAAIELYGYSRDEFLSMTIKDIRPPNEQSMLANYIHSLGKGTRRAPNRRHLKKNGSVLMVSITAYDTSFNDEPCTLVMAENVTEVLQKEEKIKFQNAALQQIAWSNSHEVRRQVCSIISLLALLQQAQDSREVAEYVGMLEQCTSELDETIKRSVKKIEEFDDVAV